MTSRIILRTAAAALLLVSVSTSCKSTIDGGEEGGSTLRLSRSAGTNDPATMASCLVAAKEVEIVVDKYCISCHGNGISNGGFDSVQSVSDMISQGRIVPGDRGMSRIYFLVESLAMPKTVEKLTADEIELVGSWIDCGATDWTLSTLPADDAGVPTGGTGGTIDDAGVPVPTPPPVVKAFYSVSDRIHWMHDDLQAHLNPVDRARIRYIDFTALSNAGATPAQVSVYKQAVSLLVNSLSLGSAVVKPKEIGPTKLIYRLDIKDYGWDAATWEIIVAAYPYAVAYNEDSRLFSFDEDDAVELRDETGTQIPYILGDWFLSHGSESPVYYDVLQIGENVNDFNLNTLGVDVNQDIADFDVERSGFALSGVAVHNRIIERHTLDGAGGAFWTTYDFVNSNEDKNVFAHPFDFVFDAGETIFHLKNGLFGYYLSNAAGVRLDVGDPNVVNDPRTRDRLITNAVSCMGGCHLNGLIAKADEVGSYTAVTAPDATFANTVYSLYPPSADLAIHLAEDNARYYAAVLQTGFVRGGDFIFLNLVLKHELTLNLADAASTLGIPSADFLASLNAHPEEFNAEVLNLRPPISSVFRETWDLQFAQTVLALGLGTQITP